METREELKELSAPDGSRVAVRGEILETRDSRGRLVFEFDSSSGRGVLYFPGAELRVASENGKVEVASSQGLRLKSEGELELIGGRGVKIETPLFETRAQEARISYGKLELVVGRFFQFARDMYQRVESLLHTRAGRVRTESRSSYHVQAERARIQAKDDVQIQGNEINLG